MLMKRKERSPDLYDVTRAILKDKHKPVPSHQEDHEKIELIKDTIQPEEEGDNLEEKSQLSTFDPDDYLHSTHKKSKCTTCLNKYGDCEVYDSACKLDPEGIKIIVKECKFYEEEEPEPEVIFRRPR